VIFLHRDCNKPLKPNACFMYYGIHSTKSPASGAGNVREPRLMSQVGGFARSRVRVDRRVRAIRVVQVWVFVCLHSCCSHMTGRRVVRFVRPAPNVVMQNHVGLCGCNPAIPPGITLKKSLFCPHSVFMFCMDLSTNSDYFLILH